MSKYTKTETVRTIICDFCNRLYPDEACEPADCDWLRMLEEDAADVAPVVRCKDCTYATLYEDSEGLYCTNICGLFTRVMDDDYCSYGGRKDGAERSGT